jgi:cytochrome d ubiquinol oxidase subunit I
MQHPVGYRIDTAANRAELTSIWKVLTNPTALVTFPHTIMASLLTGGLFMMGISIWQLTRDKQTDAFRRSMKLGVVTVLVATVGVLLSGHLQAQIMTKQQPMKMAAAEALWNTEKSAGFSLFAYGDVSRGRNKIDIKIPGLLSFLAHNNPNSTVQGVNDIQQEYVKLYGPGDYKPVVGITYWSFRLMMGLGLLSALFALLAVWLARRRRLVGNSWFGRLAIAAIAAPLLANSAGWIFTEMGRQPWIVFGKLKTVNGVSPGVAFGTVLTSLIVFTLLYAVLAVIEVRLLVRAVRAGLPEEHHEEPLDAGGAPELALVY